MNPTRSIRRSATSRWHWVLVIAMNVAVLVELCVAMYLATSSAEDFTATFMKAFFGMLIPTLAIGILGKRRLRSVPGSASG